MNPRIILTALVLALAGCLPSVSIKESSAGQTTGNSENADRLSEDNGGIPGYGIWCQWVDKGVADTGATYNCLYGKDAQSRVTLGTIASSWKWTSSLSEEDVSIAEIGDPLWQVQLVFKSPANEPMLRTSLSSSITLSYVPLSNLSDMRITRLMSDTLGDSDLKKIQERLGVSGPSADGYTAYRLSVQSVTAVYPIRDACIEELQFRIDNVWVTGSFASPNGTIGRYPASVAADSEYNQNTQGFMAFAGTYDGKYWSTAANRFSAAAPYDAIGKPARLNIDFGTQKVIITGIRIDGGDTLNNRVGECAPDVFFLEGSNDNLNWNEIPGSRGTIDTSNGKELAW